MADIVAYLYTAHYFDEIGNGRRGRQVLQSKGCLTCHSLRGRGGRVSDLAASVAAGSPITLVTAMWNHSSHMEAQAMKQAIAWPVLNGQELADLVTYLVSFAPSPASRQSSR
jgi:mono/diheme cytochrome c family protein